MKTDKKEIIQEWKEMVKENNLIEICSDMSISVDEGVFKEIMDSNWKTRLMKKRA
jgi:hypothetical protein